MTRSEAKEFIDRVFEEQALALGGLVAIHELDDDLVWRLVESMDAIRSRALRRLEQPVGAGDDRSTRERMRAHPAIQDFLASLERV